MATYPIPPLFWNGMESSAERENAREVNVNESFHDLYLP